MRQSRRSTVSAAAALLLIAVMLGGCGGSEKAVWCKEDFAFYDAGGSQVAAPEGDTSLVKLSDSEGARTHRGIGIGQPAGDALSVYDFPVDKAVYGTEDARILDKDTDLEKEIARAAAEGASLAIVVVVNGDFQPIAAKEIIDNPDSIREDVWMITFEVEEEKIADVTVGRRSSVDS